MMLTMLRRLEKCQSGIGWWGEPALRLLFFLFGSPHSRRLFKAKCAAAEIEDPSFWFRPHSGRERVDYGFAGTPGDDDARFPKNAEMVGKKGRLQLQSVIEFLHASRAREEELHYGHPCLVRKGFHDIGTGGIRA